MLNIFEYIGQWLRGLLIEGITGNLSGLFDQVNETVGGVAVDVAKTPQEWDAGVFAMVRTLSDNVVVPIAGIVLTYVLCYELVNMILEKNNMHDFDTFNIYKWIFKAFVAVSLVTHTFDITMAFFEVAKEVVHRSAGVINGSTDIQFGTALGNLAAQLDGMEVMELFVLFVETFLIRITVPALAIVVMVVLVGRMVEIYIYCSAGAIPLASMANREWGQMGNSYLRGLAALAFQGFFIMVCLAVYSALVSGIGSAPNIHAAIWGCAGYTVALCFSLLKTGSVSRSLFGGH